MSACGDGPLRWAWRRRGGCTDPRIACLDVDDAPRSDSEFVSGSDAAAAARLGEYRSSSSSSEPLVAGGGSDSEFDDEGSSLTGSSVVSPLALTCGDAGWPGDVGTVLLEVLRM